MPRTFVSNVDKIRNRGIEFAAQRRDVGIAGLELEGSVTFVDSTILSDPTFVSASGSTAVSKHVPNVPRWRATAVATYSPGERWAFTLAGRYSGKQYSTLDNGDAVSHVFGAFDRFLVFDVRARCKVSANVDASLGIDNVTNEDYFLFHPFPGRTVVANVSVHY